MTGNFKERMSNLIIELKAPSRCNCIMAQYKITHVKYNRKGDRNHG